ncbi:MAG: hypothetical protein JJ975_11420 [Bacteroidia bacterium]|nr:hypothetical protein [Bacteroidia bacterium]
MTVYFSEKQRLSQIWIWIVLGLCALIPAWGIIQQLILKQPFGNQPMPDWGLILFALLMWGFIWFLGSMTLTTKLDRNGIQFSLSPMVKKSFKWSEIDEYKIVNYGFVGGWGIRLTSTYGTIYNMAGKHGLFIKLKSGRKMVIGTQKPEKLETFLKSRLTPDLMQRERLSD